MEYQSMNIRDALVIEAREILNLIKSCFPFNYLIYSVYQSDKSLQHLENVIRDQQKLNYKEFFRVLASRDGILGFYNARSLDDNLFLNYIGTRKGFRGNNIGTLLLNDFQSFGCKIGIRKLQLDVYGSNDTAYNWYVKNGYDVEKVSYNHCFAMLNYHNTSNGFTKIEIRDLLRPKLMDESMNGFAKIKIEHDERYFEIMLIDGKVLRFQNLMNITEDEALDFTSVAELRNRKYFLFTGRQGYTGRHQVMFSEKVVRMTKLVN